MLAPQITDHVQAALNRLLQQYKGKPRMEGQLSAFVQQIQDLEDGLYPMGAGRELINSYGQQLDNIGEIIGLKRNGLAYDEYLVLLQGTIAENNSDTTITTLITIIALVFRPQTIFMKTPNSPGLARGTPPPFVAFSVGGQITPVELDPIMEVILQASIAAGVPLSYLSSMPVPKAFAMEGPQPFVGGFGDLGDPSVGGGYASLIFHNPAL